MNAPARRVVKRSAAAGALLALAGGCATAPHATPGDRLDPWENWNRKVFAFNEGLDVRVLKPVATAYKKVLPQFVRDGVTNVFGNVADGWSAVNNVLQGKFEPALRDTVRFSFNSVFGIFGVLDIAGEMGLEHQYEDFGQTLGRYGVGAGAYVVLPILGPSTVRDTAATPLDRLASPPALFEGTGTQVGFTLLQIINTRASLLGATRVIDDISLDKYTFVRDAYLQRRRSLTFDGDPPEIPAAPEEAASAAAGAAAGNVAPPAAATPASAADSALPASPPSPAAPASTPK